MTLETHRTQSILKEVLSYPMYSILTTSISLIYWQAYISKSLFISHTKKMLSHCISPCFEAYEQCFGSESAKSVHAETKRSPSWSVGQEADLVASAWILCVPLQVRAMRNSSQRGWCYGLVYDGMTERTLRGCSTFTVGRPHRCPRTLTQGWCCQLSRVRTAKCWVTRHRPRLRR